MSSGKEPEEFVRKIQEDTRRYVESLLKETERLRLLLKTSSKEKEVLTRELDSLRGRLRQQEESQRSLQGELETIQKESERFAQDFALVEQQHNDLATLYIASYRLNATLGHAEILATIEEIVTNLVGSDQVVIYETAEDGSGLKVVAFSGVEGDITNDVDFERDLIGRIARSGERYLRGDTSRFAAEAQEIGLNACIPMLVHERLVGAVAIYGLLQQKTAWADVDHQLFELIGQQAALSLYCSRLMAES